MAINSEHISSFTANTTYHVTSRAIGSLKPFDTNDRKQEFLDRIANHLSPEETHDDWGRPHVKLHDDLRIGCFNIMDNHSHTLPHQRSRDGVRKLMSRVLARQAQSFNGQTGWRGKVFSPFDATPFDELSDPTQIRDMIAYIELNNPILQFETPFASHQVLIGNMKCDWLDTSMVLGVFGGMDKYREHMNRRGPAIVRRKLLEWGLDPRRHPYRPI